MKSVAYSSIVATLLLTLCSCSDPSDTAQIPEMAAPDSQATQQSENPKEEKSLTDLQAQPDVEQPASIMAKQLKDFGSEDPGYTGDSFFQSQTSFEVPITDDVTVKDSVDFSGNLMGK